MNNNCIFCKIINGDIPCYKIYEDDIVLAFLDINPETNGHTLVIPKEHFLDIYDINEETLQHIFKCAKKISTTLTEKLNCDGFTFIQNNGEIQEVKHFHLHIRPYYTEKQEKIDIETIYKKLTA